MEKTRLRDVIYLNSGDATTLRVLLDTPPKALSERRESILDQYHITDIVEIIYPALGERGWE